MTGWAAADVPDQRGRTVIVTGANSGLGAVATRVLAEAGAKVIMACRTSDTAQAVADAIDGNTEVRRLDLATCRQCGHSPTASTAMSTC